MREREKAEAMRESPGIIICGQGCCAGCQDCYGMGMGCHQRPCRCDRPCSCRWADEDRDPKWRAGCERHDSSEDRRQACTCIEDVQCGRCGSSLAWDRCGACEATGYTIENPDPGCEVCEGTGTMSTCLSDADWCEDHPMPDCENVERHTPDYFSITCAECSGGASA